MKNAVCLGTFDGVHKGHLSVLDIPQGYNKTALIFKIPPKCVKIGVTDLLLEPKEKEERLKSMGFSSFFLEFQDVEHLTPEEFLQKLKKNLKPDLISCGFNYRFGFEGVGDTTALAEFCAKEGIALKVASPVKAEGEVISSSRIRQCIRQGEVEAAVRLLGYDFFYKAQVIKGDGRGKTLGFPTINQLYPENKVTPKFGVYITQIIIDNKTYDGITNIGHRPTYPTDCILSESYIKDFSGDLYGKEVTVILKKFLREEIKFSSAEELKARIGQDIDKI